MTSAKPPLSQPLLVQVRNLALGTHPLAKYVPPLLVLFDALLCSAIISYVAYTEIDWTAYMEQIAQYEHGERNYPLIKGGTGPLVYPAAHVYIYWMLYKVTDEGRNVLLAQRLFGILYLGTLTVVMSCYRRAKAPLYIFPMLILSKRLHSIFMLRLFNDCFAVLFLWLTIYFFQRRLWTLGSLAYTVGLGIKMTLIMPFFAIAPILFLSKGVQGALKQGFLMAQVQFVLALEFLPANAVGYLGTAFDFSRQFLFKWTVNWRFVGEETFLSRAFSGTLIVGWVSTIALFITTRWLRPAEKPILEMIQEALQFKEPLGHFQHAASIRVSPNYILTTILTSTTVGMLFARSLHYQFYAYIAWSTPFLLWRSGMHPIFQYALWMAQEWAWNVYPSSDASSKVVVGVMAVTVGSVWWGTRKDFVTLKGEGCAEKVLI